MPMKWYVISTRLDLTGRHFAANNGSTMNSLIWRRGMSLRQGRSPKSKKAQKSGIYRVDLYEQRPRYSDDDL